MKREGRKEMTLAGGCDWVASYAVNFDFNEEDLADCACVPIVL